MALWSRALLKQTAENELSAASRRLQSEIYGRRISAPVIFNWIYQWLRKSGEEEMNVAAEELVREAKEQGF